MNSVILIPAYKPDKQILSNIVEQIAAFDVTKIIIVDDGSGSDYKFVFAHLETMCKVSVLYHQNNQGKGAALRTGFRHVLESKVICDNVITVDADGQHLPEDVAKLIKEIEKYPDELVLGVRGFKGSDQKIPLRSLLGNRITRFIFSGLTGRTISDTQTGLRGIPHYLLKKTISLTSDRYAYELEMLLTLIQIGIPIKEVTITTVYEDNNSASSFRPVSDSILIYKTLFVWWLRRFRSCHFIK
ncbi:MAG: glycosyltransferase family 2 protein [Deltaproteobacteria bacterium]|nr:glycosyltransferase family 2 protein [Deltaproteobacteria bacterium]